MNAAALARTIETGDAWFTVAPAPSLAKGETSATFAREECGSLRSDALLLKFDRRAPDLATRRLFLLYRT